MAALTSRLPRTGLVKHADTSLDLASPIMTQRRERNISPHRPSLSDGVVTRPHDGIVGIGGVLAACWTANGDCQGSVIVGLCLLDVNADSMTTSTLGMKSVM